MRLCSVRCGQVAGLVHHVVHTRVARRGEREVTRETGDTRDDRETHRGAIQRRKSIGAAKVT